MRRRDLASLFLSAVPIPAQTASATPTDDLAAAREKVRAASAELAKLKVPIETEPAFQFKAY
jgi:hypothetical protein